MISRRAPGKLFVAGEFAILEPGRSAIVVAVDRYVTATVSATDDGVLRLSSEVLGDPIVVRLDRAGLLDTDVDAVAQRAAHVLAAVEVVVRYVRELGHTVGGLDIALTSGLDEGGRKLGLGSSGAVKVAIIHALTDLYGLDTSLDLRLRLALLAGIRVDPLASGGDLAASTYGGWLHYRSPNRRDLCDLATGRVSDALAATWPGFAATPLPSPIHAKLIIGWTGCPALTGTVMRSAHTPAAWAAPSFGDDSDAIAARMVAGLNRNDDSALSGGVIAAAALLRRLDIATGLGVYTPELKALCDVATTMGIAAKPSGAGGGDCGIAVIDTSTDPEAVPELSERWRTAGITPLSLRVVETRGQEATA